MCGCEFLISLFVFCGPVNIAFVFGKGFSSVDLYNDNDNDYGIGNDNNIENDNIKHKFLTQLFVNLT